MLEWTVATLDFFAGIYKKNINHRATINEYQDSCRASETLSGVYEFEICDMYIYVCVYINIDVREV